MEKLTAHLKYICSLKIVRPGSSVHACPFQPAVFSPSVYLWPDGAKPSVKFRQTVTKLPVALGQLHKCHTLVFRLEAECCTRKQKDLPRTDKTCSYMKYNTLIDLEMEQNKELDIHKLLCWHFTTVSGFSSHWLDPNQRCSTFSGKPSIKASLRTALLAMIRYKSEQNHRIL